jgi:hypothetical protein
MATRPPEQLVEEVSARLRHVCRHVSDARLAAMVRDIPEATMKFEGRVTPSLEERPRSVGPARGA